MNDETFIAVLAAMARDRLRLHGLEPGCDHELVELPVVDFLRDFRCSRCGGIESRWPDGSVRVRADA